jgi:hypothetical protein
LEEHVLGSKMVYITEMMTILLSYIQGVVGGGLKEIVKDGNQQTNNNTI